MPEAAPGFAAETGDPTANAQRKLAKKHVDLVVANDITAPGAGFDVTTNQVTLVSPDRVEPLPLMTKAEVAVILLDRVERLLVDAPVRAAQ